MADNDLILGIASENAKLLGKQPGEFATERHSWLQKRPCMALSRTGLKRLTSQV
jgi:hypothetical protein